MSAPTLFWLGLPYAKDRFFVVGTELAVAFVPDTQKRFAVYETRALADHAGMPVFFYAVRDAETVSDDDIRDGKRPAIVARFDEPNAAAEWAIAQST